MKRKEIGAKGVLTGSCAMILKYENGAQFRCPVSETVDVKAIGRGTTPDMPRK